MQSVFEVEDLYGDLGEPVVYGFLVDLKLPSKLPQIRVKKRENGRVKKSHRINTYYMNIVSGPLSAIESLWHDEVSKRLWVRVGRLNVVPPSRIPALRLFQRYVRERAKKIAENFEAFIEKGELADYRSVKRWQDARSRVMRKYLGSDFNRVSEFVSAVGRAVIMSALDRVIDDVFKVVGLPFTFSDVYSLVVRRLRGSLEWDSLFRTVKTISRWREKPKVKYFKLKGLGALYMEVVTALGFPDAGERLQWVIGQVLANPEPSWRDPDVVRRVKELVEISDEDIEFGIEALRAVLSNLKFKRRLEVMRFLRKAIVRSLIYDTPNDVLFREVIEKMFEKGIISESYEDAVKQAGKLEEEIRKIVRKEIMELREVLFSLPEEERTAVISFYRRVVKKLKNLRFEIVPILLSREVNAVFLEEFGDDLKDEVSEMEKLRRKIIEVAEDAVKETVELLSEIVSADPKKIVKLFPEFHRRAADLKVKLEDYASMIRGGEISKKLREAINLVDRVLLGNMDEIIEYVYTTTTGEYGKIKDEIRAKAQIMKTVTM